MDRQKMPHQRK